MKFSNLMKVKGLLMVAFLLQLSIASYGAFYTAVKSGAWNSPATWGGAVPPYIIESTQVSIPAGITVSVDHNIMVNGAFASLLVSGKLTSGKDDTLSVGPGTVVGNGILDINHVEFFEGTTFLFSGALVASSLSTSAGAMQSEATITVRNLLDLNDGTLYINAGGKLTMESNSTIRVGAGMLALSGGKVDLQNVYNVIYEKSSLASGMELSGKGLDNVTVAVSEENAITLASDVSLIGNLTVSSGTLLLNGYQMDVKGRKIVTGSGAISAQDVPKRIN